MTKQVALDSPVDDRKTAPPPMLQKNFSFYIYFWVTLVNKKAHGCGQQCSDCWE